MASAALPFIPVFLARLGANNFQIGLITSMPALAGLFLSIPLGQFLQKKTNIVPWYSITRAIVLSRFALIGLITLIIPPQSAILVILVIWAIFTVPQTLLSTLFNMVMNSVAGPQGRFELMTRRWSLLGFVTAITIFLTGQVLTKIAFPLNYQIVLIAFALGGVLSYQFSHKLDIPQHSNDDMVKGTTPGQKLQYFYQLISEQKPFIRFAVNRFVFAIGMNMAVPLLPIYYVKEIHAPDSWIAIISTTQTAIAVIGYFFWLKQSRTRGSRFVLVATTLFLPFYPVLVALSSKYWLLALLAGFQGILEAGLNLIFFDELMKTVPDDHTATFVSIAQSIQFLASTLAPAIGTTLADLVGIQPTLFLAGFVQFIGFLLFLVRAYRRKGNSTLT